MGREADIGLPEGSSPWWRGCPTEGPIALGGDKLPVLEYPSRGGPQGGLAGCLRLLLRSTLRPRPALALGRLASMDPHRPQLPQPLAGLANENPSRTRETAEYPFPRLPPCRATLGLRTSGQVTASLGAACTTQAGLPLTSGFPSLLSPSQPKEGHSLGIAITNPEVPLAIFQTLSAPL